MAGLILGGVSGIAAILVQIVSDNAKPKASRAGDLKVIGRQVIVSDEARTAAWIDTANFAVSVAVGAFDIDNHASPRILRSNWRAAACSMLL